jgi:hypothetical protein
VSEVGEESVDMSIHAGRAHALREREPLLVRFDEERRATALMGALDGTAGAEVRQNGETWEVLLACAKTDSMVAGVLDAVRRILAGDAGASAQILLDGREYIMEGE